MKETNNLFKRSILDGLEILLLHEELQDKDEIERRYRVCNSNDGICFSKKTDKCKFCGCFMSIKTKMLKHKNPKKFGRIEITHCPLAKWGKDIDEKAYEKEKEIVNYYRSIDKKKLLT